MGLFLRDLEKEFTGSTNVYEELCVKKDFNLDPNGKHLLFLHKVMYIKVYVLWYFLLITFEH